MCEPHVVGSGSQQLQATAAKQSTHVSTAHIKRLALTCRRVQQPAVERRASRAKACGRREVDGEGWRSSHARRPHVHAVLGPLRAPELRWQWSQRSFPPRVVSSFFSPATFENPPELSSPSFLTESHRKQKNMQVHQRHVVTSQISQNARGRIC